MSKNELISFIEESNRIEGIVRMQTVLNEERASLVSFMSNNTLSVDLVCTLAFAFEPRAKLRDRAGMDVMIGEHRPPRGGKHISSHLSAVLNNIRDNSVGGYMTPYEVHCDFETLHPFMDGNGRTGRAIWLWQMVKRDGVIPPLGFLHTFYYQTLAERRVGDV